MLQRTWMVIWKEFKQISRDPRLLGFVFLQPVVMLFLFGKAVNLDVEHIKLVVYDQSRSRISRDILDSFTRGRFFDLTVRADSYSDLVDALDRSTARIGLVLPRNLDRELASGRTAYLQVIVDGSDSTTAGTGVGYVAEIVQQYSTLLAVEALDRSGAAMTASATPIDNRVRYWYNPEMRSTNFIIPGLIALILMMLSALLTSVTVVRERERGTIEQLVVSPIRPIELMLGKLTPYVLIAFGDVLLVVAVSALVFHVPIVGSLTLVLGISFVFLVTALGIGLLISTVAPNQQVAMLGAVMSTQLPTVFLSGFLFPITSMPRALQIATQVIPARHFISILRQIFLKGNGLDLLWRPSLFLVLFGVAVILASSARFKKKI